jgi:CDGSH-type Zn-finger protein
MPACPVGLLHRRLRGAIVGHLAVFEMTSSIPNRRCRCGRSARKPFCDGMHKAVGWKAPSGAPSSLDR